MSNKNSSDFWNSPTFKGLAAVMGTLLVVVIIVMLAAKVMFVSDTSAENKKTGRITSTEPKSVVTTTTTKATKKTVKKTKREYNTYDGTQIDTDEYTNQTVISAVYLHPEPNSSSENLCVIPVGAVCKVYKNENGWLYLDYDGQKGYAYYTFFTETQE